MFLRSKIKYIKVVILYIFCTAKFVMIMINCNCSGLIINRMAKLDHRRKFLRTKFRRCQVADISKFFKLYNASKKSLYDYYLRHLQCYVPIRIRDEWVFFYFFIFFFSLYIILCTCSPAIMIPNRTVRIVCVFILFYNKRPTVKQGLQQKPTLKTIVWLRTLFYVCTTILFVFKVSFVLANNFFFVFFSREVVLWVRYLVHATQGKRSSTQCSVLSCWKIYCYSWGNTSILRHLDSGHVLRLKQNFTPYAIAITAAHLFIILNHMR